MYFLHFAAEKIVGGAHALSAYFCDARGLWAVPFFKGYNLLVCSCYYFFCSTAKLLLCPPKLDTWLGCYTFNTSNGRPCGFCWMERPGIKAEDGRPTTAQSASWHPTNSTDSTMSRILLIALSLAVFVAVSYGHEGPAGHTHPEDAAVAPLDAKPAAEAVALKPATVAAGAAGSADGRPKRQFGLGYLIGSALGGGYGYGRPYGGYGGYGGYGRPSGYGGYGGGYGGYGGGYGHGHRPYHGHGYGYGR